MDSRMWEIDVNNYDDNNISLLLDCKQQIIDSLGEKNNPSDTLITKIMLGVFANVPAFDTYFRKSLNVYLFNRKALMKIKNFYNENKDVFDTYQIHTFDFLSSEETDIVYTKAKLIDMYGFIDGIEN
jgi:hypothetical protein